jgi:phosphatidylinositol glycan class W
VLWRQGRSTCFPRVAHPSALGPLIWEGVALLGPLLLASTLLSGWVEGLVGTLLTTALLLRQGGVLMANQATGNLATSAGEKRRTTLRPRPRPATPSTPLVRANLHEPSLLVFRVFLQLSTILCILAVDFHVFPRKFAKVETFGTSLMDLGVGGFLFSAGVVSGRRPGAPAPTARASNHASSSWRRALWSAFPLLAIGAVRTALTKSVNYQEHVSEYGVHWNFFYTLGVIPLLSVLQQALLPSPRGGEGFAVAAVLMGAYTWALERRGLQAYILETPRLTWLSANREGVCSLLGYYSIFLVAREVGWMMLEGHRELASRPPPRQPAVAAAARWSSQCRLLLALGGFLFALLFTLTRLVGLQVSRRMANLPYCLWVCAVCVYFILVIHLVMGPQQPSQPVGEEGRVHVVVPVLFEAMNANPLLLFLLVG